MVVCYMRHTAREMRGGGDVNIRVHTQFYKQIGEGLWTGGFNAAIKHNNHKDTREQTHNNTHRRLSLAYNSTSNNVC